MKRLKTCLFAGILTTTFLLSNLYTVNVMAAKDSISEIWGDMNKIDSNGGEFDGPHTVFVKADGSAWEYGKLNEDENTKPVKKMDDVKVVSAGVNHSIAVKNDGSLWVWGKNVFGQLGKEIESSKEPVKIMDGVSTASAGRGHSVALKNDGTLWGWGLNEQGQLGFKPKDLKNEDDIIQKTPVKIMDDVAAVSAHGYQTMVIKKDGSLWGAGGGIGLTNNGGASVGNGKKESTYEFVKVMDNVTGVCTGALLTAAVKNDGSLWQWQTGVPQKVDDDVISVSIGYLHVLYIKKDGSLWSGGNNYSGELGDGTKETKTSTVKVLDNVIDVSAGAFCSFAEKADGSLWAWGAINSFGYGTEDKPTVKPIKIMDGIALPIKYNSSTGISSIKKEGQLFSDVEPGSKLESALKVLGKAGIMSGNTDGTFGTKDGFKRSQAAKVIVNLLGKQNEPIDPSKNISFNDVTPQTPEWARKSILKAAELGIFSGNPDGSFKPDDYITNEQLLKILVNASGEEDKAKASGLAWPDNYIKAANDLGLGEGLDMPKGKTAVRENVALVVYEVLKKLRPELVGSN